MAIFETMDCDDKVAALGMDAVVGLSKSLS